MRNEAAVWNRFSGMYDALMKRDMPAYRRIVEKARALVKPHTSVLEIATGTGILALELAGSVEHMEAMDFSLDMIERARQKARSMGISNVRFSVQDAYSLAYDAESFDIVIISNTLHIMPVPEKALSEIKRVLKPKGILIAPTFVHAETRKAALLSRLISITGFRAYHRWTRRSYTHFLKDSGFTVEDTEMLPASFPFVYCRCSTAVTPR